MFSLIFALGNSLEFPTCNKTIEISSYMNSNFEDLFMPANSTYCFTVLGKDSFTGQYAAFAFNKWTSIEVCMWIHDGNEYVSKICTPYNSSIGGATLGQSIGSLTFHSTNETTINIGYSTFLKDCDHRTISTHNDDYGDLALRTRSINCYYNALPTSIEYQVYANSTSNNCYYQYVPYSPSWKYLNRGTYTSIISLSETSILVYQCSNNYRKTKTRFYAESQMKGEYYTKFTVGLSPSFYAVRSYWEDTLATIMIFVYIFGFIFLIFFVVFWIQYFNDRPKAIKCLECMFCCDSNECECCASGCINCCKACGRPAIKFCEDPSCSCSCSSESHHNHQSYVESAPQIKNSVPTVYSAPPISSAPPIQQNSPMPPVMQYQVNPAAPPLQYQVNPADDPYES